MIINRFLLMMNEYKFVPQGIIVYLTLNINEIFHKIVILNKKYTYLSFYKYI